MVWEYPPRVVGGLGTYASEMTRQLTKMGHGVKVITMNVDPDTGLWGSLPAYERINGVEVYRPAEWFHEFNGSGEFEHWTRRIGHNDFLNQVYVYNLLASRIQAEIGCDILSVHDWLSGLSALTAPRCGNPALVFHVHSTEFGRSMGNPNLNLLEFEKAVAGHADHVVTVSFAMRDELAKLGFGEGKVSVCWNGVDPEKYSQARVPEGKALEVKERYGVGDDEVMMLYVGRLTAVKGLLPLLLSMEKVRAEVPNVKLVVVGRGELEGRLLETASKLNLSGEVKFRFEFLSEEERIQHYAACNLAVFPSLYEPFGIVCLEAMSMGKPVVVGASGTSGFREQVIPSGDPQCGIHVDGSNPADIAWGVVEALRSRDRMDEWGRNGRSRVLKHFTLEQAAERTLEVYSTLLPACSHR